MLMRMKATLIIMAIIVIFTVASFFLSLSFTQRHMTDTMEQELALALDIADSLISTHISLLKSNAETVAARLEAVSDSQMPEVMAVQMEEFKDFVSLTVYDQTGTVANYGEPINHDVVQLECEYIQAAFNGEGFLSSVHCNDANDNLVIHAFVPMGSERILSATFPGLFFSDILSKYRLWQTGSVFMVDAKGTFVASLRPDLVMEQRNFIEDAKSDKEFESASEFYKEMIADKRASGRYIFDGKERICVAKHVAGSKSGWYIGVVAPLSESPLKTVQNALLLAALLFLAVGVFVAIIVSGIVIKPFITIQHQAAQIQAEHERSTLLLDAMPLSCRLWSRDYKIFECNDEAVKLFGMQNKQEYMAKHFELSPEFQPDGQRSYEKTRKTLDRVFNEENEIVLEWMHQLPDGTLLPAEITLVRVNIKGEDFIASYTRDLREHEQMMAAIDRQNDLLQVGNRTAQVLLGMEGNENIDALLLDSLELVGSAVGADRVQIWKNKVIAGNLHFIHTYSWYSDLGKQKTHIPSGLSFPYSDVPRWNEMFLRGEYMNGPLSELPQDDQIFLNAYDIKTIANIPLFVRDKFWGFVSIVDCGRARTFSRDEIDILRSASLMMANVINLHESSKKLEAARQDAEKANDAKSSFLAKMSHEMRTPLNAIIGLADLALENEILDDEVATHLEKIHSAGMTLLSTVNDILDISKIESGKFELVLTVYDVPSLINDVVSQSMMHTGEKPIEFILTITENIPSQLYGDELRIRQILNNILSNALKYTRKGTVELGIDCAVEGETAHVNVYVRDTGIGIHAEDLDDLFTDYVQMDSQRNRNILGTGLGLSITKGMVDLMGGTITAESEYGKGTTFTVRIPQRIVNNVVIGQEMADNLKNFHYFEIRRQLNSKLPRINLPYARVLLVDDVASNLDVAKGLMKPYNMQIVCVTSGQQAIDAIQNETVCYNAVFMDHMMPGMDGIETTRRIREIGTDYAKTIPIIALTANALMGNEEMFLDKGFQAFISKPIDLVRLDTVIRQWVRNRDLEQQSLDPQVAVNGVKVPDTRSGRERRADAIRRSGFDRRKLGRLYYVLNVKKGLERFDGDKETYLGVLRSFAVHSKPLLENLKKIERDSLADYAISVHGIKGSSRGIFAEEIGRQAEVLEKAAKAKDFDFVNENNQGFIQTVETLIKDIETLLDTMQEDDPKPKMNEPDKETLTKLLASCKKYDMDGACEAMSEIERYEYESDEEIVPWLREHIDESNFSAIIEKLSYLEAVQ